MQKSWAKKRSNPPPNFLTTFRGQVPAGLRGTLYCNGPARLERGGVVVTLGLI